MGKTKRKRKKRNEKSISGNNRNALHFTTENNRSTLYYELDILFFFNHQYNVRLAVIRLNMSAQVWGKNLERKTVRKREMSTKNKEREKEEQKLRDREEE